MLKVMPDAAKGVFAGMVEVMFEVVYGGSDKRRGAARKDGPTEVQRVVDRNTRRSCAIINVNLAGRGGDERFDADVDAESVLNCHRSCSTIPTNPNSFNMYKVIDNAWKLYESMKLHLSKLR
jgi:hypothetical protein